MTSFRFRFLAILISACGLLAGPASAQRDETDTSGGTFSTPGYPTRNGQFPSANPALQGGAGNPQLQGQSPRPGISPNGSTLDPRPGISPNGACRIRWPGLAGPGADRAYCRSG